MKPGSRHQWVQRSALRSMSVECEKVNGVNLSQGVCDLTIPEPVRTAAKHAIDNGPNSYSRHDGTADLREAIAANYQRRAGLSIDPETEVVVSSGATGALYCACLALLEPGDEVIVFEPYYSYHRSTLIATGAVPVFVKTPAPTWDIDLDDFEAAITPRTRAVIINTPSNPSGKIWTRDELTRMAELCEKHDLIAFTDEIYEYFLYDDHEHISPASLEGMWERSVTISGLSKTFSITGWRIGYCLAPAEVAAAIGNFSDLVYVCSPTPLQLGAAAGLMQLGDDYFEGLAAKYKKKRDRLCSTLDAVGLTPCVPQGAYYVLADTSSLPGANSTARAMHLLNHAGVAAVPGQSFFTDGDGDAIARFCFAKEDEVIDEACERLEAHFR